MEDDGAIFHPLSSYFPFSFSVQENRTMPLSQQELEEELAHQRQLSHELRRRLHVLELQRAQQGQQVLPQVVLEIESLTEEIQTYEPAIARLERLLSAIPPLYRRLPPRLLRLQSHITSAVAIFPRSPPPWLAAKRK
jgi:uncharacterized protein YhaN